VSEKSTLNEIIRDVHEKKKYKKESTHSKLIMKSNDNVLLGVYYYVRLFTILVSMLFL